MRVIGYYHYAPLDDDNEPPVSQMQKVTSENRSKSAHRSLRVASTCTFIPPDLYLKSVAPDLRSYPTNTSFQHLLLTDYCFAALQQQQDNSTNFPRKRFQFQSLIFCFLLDVASEFMTHLNACNPFPNSFSLSPSHLNQTDRNTFRVLVTWSGEPFKTTISITSLILT